MEWNEKWVLKKLGEKKMGIKMGGYGKNVWKKGEKGKEECVWSEMGIAEECVNEIEWKI